MAIADARGCPVSGATPAALAAYERGLAAFQCWRSGADAELALALREAPEFVMAHALQAYLLLCSRDPRRIQSAKPWLVRALGLPANDCERLHLGAIAAVLAGDYQRAKARLGDVLLLQPRDVIALQVAHAFDYLTGDVARLADRVAAVLPAWSSDVPGHHAVLAMHAFGLEECGDYARAERTARAALALNAGDARAHHVMAHVFEMTDRPDSGVQWMHEHLSVWSADTVVATHCWWHIALFHLARGRFGDALSAYDRRIRSTGFVEVADLVDASALLWRLSLLGTDAGARWQELAAAWTPHIDDGFCSFNDVHAMLAFVGANDNRGADRLVSALMRARTLNTRHGETTRQIGLPACRALIEFGRNRDARAISLLAGLPMLAHRLGGSHAQRDVLNLTLLKAVERVRRHSARLELKPVNRFSNRNVWLFAGS